LKDLVVILPGLLGSKLADKNGTVLWGTGMSWIRGVFDRGKLQQGLKLGEDRPSADELEDGIKSVGAVEKVHMIPGLKATQSYDVLKDRILRDKNLKAKLDENLRVFHYDWRRTIRHGAHRLKMKCDEWLEFWRAESGNGDAKLVLLGHSMGGLVARYYLEALGGWKNCRKLATFGTPHQGAVQPLEYVLDGYHLPRMNLTELVRSCTSVYELMADYKCIQADGEVKTIAEYYSDDSNMQRAAGFHRELGEHEERNRGSDEYLNNRYILIPHVGYRQKTIQSAYLSSSKILFSERHPSTEKTFGDGTVPAWSGSPRNFDGQAVYIGTSHGCIPMDEAVITNIIGMLSVEDHPIPKYCGSTVISLDFSDAYEVGKPINGRVVSDALVEARVQVFNTDNEELLIDMVHTANGADKLSLDIENEGIYRLKVSDLDHPDQACNKFILVG
jgi:lecithin:cholesterol acyltransferase